ncbi:MAG: protein-L-isoaspartate(D-aspartate) O-methyltransferase [Actinomycetota bacterium]
MPRSKEGMVRLLRRDGVTDERVLAAFRHVAREEFVPSEARSQAYADRPIGILEGQTTSQPSLIARMIEAARIDPEDRVLEVGTGFGFQTALLARLAAEVVSIDRFASLIEVAEANLSRAGIKNVRSLVGDGWEGVPEHAPYGAIVVSAAATEVPPALKEQLSDGGRLVIPVKAANNDEVLIFEKDGDELKRIGLLTPARFVPLVPGAPG